MSTQFIRRGTLAAGRLTTPVDPGSLYTPIGTQHSWWATDLTASYADAATITSWPDTTGSLDLLTDDVNSMDYNGLGGRATVSSALSDAFNMEVDISALTYTSGSLLAVTEFSGLYSGCVFVMYAGSGAVLSASLQHSVGPNAWEILVNYYISSGNVIYLSGSVARTGTRALFEVEQTGSGVIARVNGTPVTLSVAYEEGGLDETDVTVWIADFDDLQISSAGSSTDPASLSLALMTDTEPTDRADLFSWAETYYGL